MGKFGASRRPLWRVELEGIRQRRLYHRWFAQDRRDRLTEALKTLSCGHLMTLQQFGSMPPELMRNIRTVCPRSNALSARAVDRIRGSLVAASAALQSERAKPA